jgi:hypothetical protein
MSSMLAGFVSSGFDMWANLNSFVHPASVGSRQVLQHRLWIPVILFAATPVSFNGCVVHDEVCLGMH